MRPGASVGARADRQHLSGAVFSPAAPLELQIRMSSNPSATATDRAGNPMTTGNFNAQAPLDTDF